MMSDHLLTPFFWKIGYDNKTRCNIFATKLSDFPAGFKGYKQPHQILVFFVVSFVSSHGSHMSSSTLHSSSNPPIFVPKVPFVY
jgi:hypothetical protein